MSTTSYVILGMLRLGARTGYEIKRSVDLSTRFFWAASHAQIYPDLKRLEKAGLISGTPKPRGGRRRVVYRLEPAGEAALRNWLTSEESLIFELRDLALLKLFFADLLDRGQALALVRARRANHERMRSKLKQSEPAAQSLAVDGPKFPYKTLRFGLEMHDWFIDWCERLEDQLESGEFLPSGSSSR